MPSPLEIILPIFCPLGCMLCLGCICSYCAEEPSQPLPTFQQQLAQLYNSPQAQTIQREQPLIRPPGVYQNELVNIPACDSVKDHSCGSSCSVEVTSLRNSQQRAPPSDYRHSVVDELARCPICLEDFQDIKVENEDGSNTNLCMIRKCEHRFHRSCIQKWLESENLTHKTCPICREAILQ